MRSLLQPRHRQGRMIPQDDPARVQPTALTITRSGWSAWTGLTDPNRSCRADPGLVHTDRQPITPSRRHDAGRLGYGKLDGGNGGGKPAFSDGQRGDLSTGWIGATTQATLATHSVRTVVCLPSGRGYSHHHGNPHSARNELSPDGRSLR